MTTRRYVVSLAAIFVVAVTLRVLWIRADPAVQETVGVVWHDEGAWVHNARNRALWGVWRTDAWNPVFIAPVFTALVHASFREFGVGLWQARVVPVVSGLAALAFLIVGLEALAGRRAAAIGGVLLATNYAFVMWNRAALMESTMTACIVAGWAAYALAERRPAWGLVAGAASVLAWFTKGSAAFFVAALALDAVLTLVLATAVGSGVASRSNITTRRAAIFALAGLVVTALAIGALFVLPHWTEYEFYNWQMTVVRKPEYSLTAFVNRASWLPVVEDVFTRMWLVFATGILGALLITARWKAARPAERLVVLWVLVGFIELVVHDSGNERRYVMFIPALAALSALVLASDRSLVPSSLAAALSAGSRRIAAIPALVFAGYLVFGAFLRPVFGASVNAGHLSGIVRLSAGLAVVAAIAVYWRWSAVVTWLSVARIPRQAAPIFLAIAVVWNGVEYVRWAANRGEKNYQASVALGRLLPAGTLVQGKLANGMALESRIRPLFVGNGFGNYDDRLRRDDARYILTYDLPQIGYESSAGSGLIQGILDHYPGWRVIATFEVDETPGDDRAVLIDKFPDRPPPHAHD